MDTETRVEPSRDNPDLWVWWFKVDGETVADGEAPDQVTARARALAAFEEWRAKQC